MSGVTCQGTGRPWVTGTNFKPICSHCHRGAAAIGVAAPSLAKDRMGTLLRGTFAGVVPAHDAPIPSRDWTAEDAPPWDETHVVLNPGATNDLIDPRHNRGPADLPSFGFKVMVSSFALLGVLIVVLFVVTAR